MDDVSKLSHTRICVRLTDEQISAMPWLGYGLRRVLADHAPQNLPIISRGPRKKWIKLSPIIINTLSIRNYPTTDALLAGLHYACQYKGWPHPSNITENWLLKCY